MGLYLDFVSNTNRPKHQQRMCRWVVKRRTGWRTRRPCRRKATAQVVDSLRGHIIDVCTSHCLDALMYYDRAHRAKEPAKP